MEKCDDPFEEGKIIVMINFSLFMLITNLPYTFISFHSFPGHFISAIVQNVAMLAVILLLNRGYRLNLARNLFFANFFLQNIYHFFINNGGSVVIAQGIAFFTLIVLFAFLLYGSRFGWLMFVFICGQITLGIYNENTGNSLFNFPAEYADPVMEGDMAFMILLPLAMNIYLVSEFVKAQRKAKDRIYIQNSLLAEKNREITDSINYAKRIQEAILPAVSLIRKSLNDSFVLYKPKDIVAGDFYFLHTSEDKTYLGVADCTGHGVPGAMLSVVCSNSLTRAIKETGLDDPGKILDHTREIVLSNLSATEKDMKDGMDISFAVFDKRNSTVCWSGANNPLWLIRNNQLIEYKGDKQPIGIHHSVSSFKSHSIALQKGDAIYMMTDGYKDQFGGEKQKKFSARRLKETLLRIHRLPVDHQCTELERVFNEWRNQAEQIDDVCIAGVMLS